MSEGYADTSVLVRYLTGEPEEMAQRAARLVEGANKLRVTSVVLAETAYVLQSVYKVPRIDVVDALQGLVMRRNVVLDVGKEHIVRALELCRPSTRVSFADALIWAKAVTDPCRRVFTFDQRFPDHEIEVVFPELIIGADEAGRTSSRPLSRRAAVDFERMPWGWDPGKPGLS